ncbi:MAG: Uma2 family endonuclease [Calditrichaeota bacterium]|nr:MAG: Uma2 family endonuclease [Calditrichota bacterium]
MTQVQEKKYYTLEEYFELESKSDEKHEFYKGEIFAMSGGSFNHNLIASNILGEFRNLLKGKPCIVLGSDLKVQVKENGLYTYPDVSVICGEPEFVEERNDTVKNPLLIVEVLSESTADYDKGGKFTLYRDIDSLRHYILVEQKEARVEYFYKNEKEHWELVEFRNVSETLKIENLNIEIPLDEIYQKITFEEKN